MEVGKWGKLSSFALSTSQATQITKNFLPQQPFSKFKILSWKMKGRLLTLSPSPESFRRTPQHHLPTALPPHASPRSMIFPTPLLPFSSFLPCQLPSWKVLVFTSRQLKRALSNLSCFWTLIPVTLFSKINGYLAASPVEASGWLPNYFSEAKQITHYNL